MELDGKKVVTLDYRLSLDSGEEVDRSPEGRPLRFITGAGMIIPGLEKGLSGVDAGFKGRISVAPAEAYGDVDPALVQKVPRAQFPPEMELAPGKMFHAEGPRGLVNITVTGVTEGEVTIDLNHPLAGKRLNFDVSILEVRDPEAEELRILSGAGCGCGSSCGSAEEGGSCGADSCGSTGCGCAG
jgi:FKBP-type peptidyl-prolyl cis-trans isomerase SlyD